MIAMAAKCPRCGARPKVRCSTPKGKKRAPHAGRQEAGMRARLWMIGHVVEKMKEKGSSK